MLAVLAAFYAVTVSVRAAEYGVVSFVHVGEDHLLARADTAFDAPHVELVWKGEGYDGQYYWAIAVDPVGARDYIPDELEGYVYSRPLYPTVARATSLGISEVVPYSMLALSLLAVGAGTLGVGVFLRRRAVTPWYALVFGLFPGLVLCVFRDLTEPLAFGLAAVAIAVFDRRTSAATWGAAGLLALATLTRETVAVFSLTIAAALVLGLGDSGDRPNSRARRWRTGIAFMLVTLHPLAAWRGFLLYRRHRRPANPRCARGRTVPGEGSPGCVARGPPVHERRGVRDLSSESRAHRLRGVRSSCHRSCPCDGVLRATLPRANPPCLSGRRLRDVVDDLVLRRLPGIRGRGLQPHHAQW